MDKDLFTLYHQQRGSIQKKWGWLFCFGLLLTLLGTTLILEASLATDFSIVLFGSLLVTIGLIQLAQALLTYSWNALFISLLMAILYVVAGTLCIFQPTLGTFDLTLLISALCVIGGLFRILASLIIRFERWKLVLTNGVVSCLVGALIYSEWPLSSLWTIGILVGLDILFSGIVLLIITFFIKKHTS